MSNDTNVYERLWKLWAMICKMVMDGTRDASQVADMLQSIVDSGKQYLRQLCVVELPATSGEETFKGSGLFTGGIYGLAVPAVAQGKPTAATQATVWEMVLDGIFAQLFGSVGGNRRRFTEAQVVRFCRDHHDKLRGDGYGTFFEMEGDVVAIVSFDGDGHLDVDLSSFSHDDVWSARCRHRVVSLQQAA